MFILRLLGRTALHEAQAGNGPTPDQADAPLERIADGAPPAHGPLGYGDLGRQAELRGDLKRALRLYELASARSDGAPWVEQRLSAVAVVLGHYPVAIASQERLSASDPRDALAKLAIGSLLMLDGRHEEACRMLEQGIELLAHEEGDMISRRDETGIDGPDNFPQAVAGGSRPGALRVQTLARRGLNYLARGRFVRATELFQDAMNLVDALSVAHGQWLLAQSRAEGGVLPEHLVQSLVSLAQLSDLLLQYLARTKLADSLARVLRERQLRHDLASWATGCQEVQRLLRTEQSRLSELAAAHPNHAELFYRIGICSRATGELEHAANAFQRVLAIEPHHTKSGVRLAATLLQLHRVAGVTEILERTFALEPADAWRYYALGLAASDCRKFDRALAALAQDLGDGFATRDVKANLAFALGMLGIKDTDKDEWKEPRPCPVQQLQ